MQDKRVAEIGRALGKDMRVKVIRELRGSDEPISPSGFAELHGLSLGNVSYHFKVLRDLKVAKISKQVPRRGAIESYHELGALNGPAVIRVIEALEGSA